MNTVVIPTEIRRPDIVALMSTTAATWLAAFAEQLGVEAPSAAEFEDLLALAGTAAHASERTAAPVACWLAAHAGFTAREARELALSIIVPDADLAG